MTTDLLIVKGLGKNIDGRYELSLMNLISLNSPDSLDTRELHRLKLIANVRPADLRDAVIESDAAVMVALAVIVLARNGKTVPEERVWDCRLLFSAGGSEPPALEGFDQAIHFHIFSDDEALEEGELDPPAVPPATEA